MKTALAVLVVSAVVAWAVWESPRIRQWRDERAARRTRRPGTRG